MELDFNQASRELLRALRGKRSQTVFSRRLGFRSNVAAKWEAGQRMPTATQALDYSRRLGIDVPAVLRRFQPNVEVHQADGAIALHRWLAAQRGAQRLSEIAKKSGLSRYSVGRFLTSQSEPRLPQFLSLIEALTQRSDEFVDAWVGIDHIPALRSRFIRVQAARRAMTQRPLCLAVLCLLDTSALRERDQAAQEAALGQLLDRPLEEMRECLDVLCTGGVIALSGDRYLPISALTVDTRTDPSRQLALQGYWARLAAQHAETPGSDDVCSYNVFSIGREGYSELRQLQREFYRTARALIAASEPTQVAGLLVVQMIAWDPDCASDQL